MDFSAEWYDQQVSHLIQTVIAFGLISLVVGILIVMLITRQNRKRYRTLYRQLNELRPEK